MPSTWRPRFLSWRTWGESSQLGIGGVDRTTSASRMTVSVINAVAQFERDLLIERTQAGLARAKTKGVLFGRPSTSNAEQEEAILLPP